MHEERLALVAAHDRHDVRVARAELEAGLLQLFRGSIRLLVELRTIAGPSARACREWSTRPPRRDGEGGAEEEAPRRVLHEVGHVLRAEEDAADAAERLREGRDDDRHLAVEPISSTMPVPRSPSVPVPCASSTRRTASYAREISTNSAIALSPSRRVDALDEHERVLALARLQDAPRLFAELWLKKRPPARRPGARGEERPPSRMQAWL